MIPHLVADEVRRNGAPFRPSCPGTTTTGCAASRSVYQTPSRSTSASADRRARPVRPARKLAEHFREPLARIAGPAKDPGHRDQPRDVHLRRVPERSYWPCGGADIGAVLARYRTKRSDALPADEGDEDGPQTAVYYPFRPYCATCGRDDTTVTGFDDETTEITYTCGCGAVVGPVPIPTWPGSWPGRSTGRCGGPRARDVQARRGRPRLARVQLHRRRGTGNGDLGGECPALRLAFVGAHGSAKLSGSRGGAPTPADALEIFEAALLRWLYARRRPERSITLAFNNEVGRAYDEWDALSLEVAKGNAEQVRLRQLRPRSSASDGPSRSPAPAEVLHPGLGGRHHGRRRTQMLRIVRGPDRRRPGRGLDEVRPRLDCAQAWSPNTSRSTAGPRSATRPMT